MSLKLEVLARFRAGWHPPAEGPLTLLLSGGGDSTALFHLLRHGGYDFGCLHFQHDSPGEFAATSSAFCRDLCLQHAVALETVSAAVEETRRQGDLSWEAAASRLRYQAVASRAGVFLTAHTADDQAETVIMRLLDGAGLAGLAGIRATRKGRIQRPLLGFRRSVLRDYLAAIEQPWVDDPTNREGNDRARIRHGLLPELEEKNPALVASLCRTAQSLAADEDALTELARAWLFEHTVQGDHWSLRALRELHPSLRHRVLREIWRQASDGTRRPLGGVFRDGERLVMHALDDRQVIFPGGNKLRKIGAWLWLEPEAEAVPWSVSVPKAMRRPLISASWVLLPPGVDDDYSAEWIRLPLPAGVFAGGKQYEVRSRRPGDTFRDRSLKKLLAATGHPPWVRDRWPLLVCGDQVVSIPGLGALGDDDKGEGWLLFRPQCWRWRAER